VTTLAVPPGPENGAEVDWNLFLINLLVIVSALAAIWFVYWLLIRGR
jgi:hypothetical protein